MKIQKNDWEKKTKTKTKNERTKKKKIPKMKTYKILPEKKEPQKILQQSSFDIQKLLTGSLRTKTTPTPPLNQFNLLYKT